MGLDAAVADAERRKLVDEDLADVQASLELLKRSITRAVSIIHDLQGFSQLGKGDLTPVDLRRVVDDAAISCQNVFGPEGRVKLEVDIAGEGGEPVVLKAFPTLLIQVFVNLFTNAAQAIQGPGKVSVLGRAKGDRVRIEVRDTGPGIPPEHLPRLFEPFFTTKGTSGTGLGLALVYAYLEKHGGTIEAKSEPGKGAVFTIDLPLEATAAVGFGPRASSIFEGPTDSTAEVARGRRGG
jgi:signal transduction histidine kinase